MCCLFLCVCVFVCVCACVGVRVCVCVFFCMCWVEFCYDLGSKGSGYNLLHNITDFFFFFCRSSFVNCTCTKWIKECDCNNKKRITESKEENVWSGGYVVHTGHLLCLLFQTHQSNNQQIQTSFTIPFKMKILSRLIIIFWSVDNIVGNYFLDLKREGKSTQYYA